MKIDLHMHSDHSSDGQFPVSVLAEIAKESGLNVLALSDHDSVAGVADMIEAARPYGIEVIPAIECSTLLGDQAVHMLGYGVDLSAPYFQDLALRISEANKDTFHQRVLKMEEKYGVHIDEEAVLQKAQGKNPWFTMILDMLEDPIIQAHPDWQDYLPGGKRADPAPVNFYWDNCMPGSDLYVESWSPDFFDTIDEIHNAHGVAIIAHPFTTFYQREDLLQQAIDRGIDGLEVYSNYHTPEQNAWYAQYAKDHDLLMTCGSDFHGEKKPSILMGEYGYAGDGAPFYDALQAAIAKRAADDASNKSLQ